MGQINMYVKGVKGRLSYEKCKWIIKNLLSTLYADGVDFKSSSFVFTARPKGSKFCVKTNVIWRKPTKKTKRGNHDRSL
jgi:hypothetical protein